MWGFSYNLLFWESPALSLVCVTGWLFVKRLGARFGLLIPSVPGHDCGRHAVLDTTLQCDGWWLGPAVRILSCSLDHSRGELTKLSAGMLHIINCQTNVGKRDYSLFCILCCFVVSNEDLWLPHNGIINCMAKAIWTPIEAKNLVSAKTWKWAIPH